MHPTLHAQSEADILTLSSHQLVPALYARMLEHLRGAVRAIEAGELEAKAHHLEHALAILFELMASLDLNGGGEVAPRLMALYSYFASEIVSIGRTLDVELLGRIVEMIAGLHESWEQAALATSSFSGFQPIIPVRDRGS
jgi:flagellar secretion chaperone FliS